MRFTMLITATLFILVASACNHKDSDAGPPKAVKIPQLGLQIDLPGRAKVEPYMDGVTINGKVFGEIFLEVEKQPQTVESVKNDATAIGKASNFKSETLSDGFVATYDYTMGETKASSVVVHRLIAGKQVSCKANSSDKKWLDATVAACKTLRI